MGFEGGENGEEIFLTRFKYQKRESLEQIPPGCTAALQSESEG